LKESRLPEDLQGVLNTNREIWRTVQLHKGRGQVRDWDREQQREGETEEGG